MENFIFSTVEIICLKKFMQRIQVLRKMNNLEKLYFFQAQIMQQAQKVQQWRKNNKYNKGAIHWKFRSSHREVL